MYYIVTVTILTFSGFLCAVVVSNITQQEIYEISIMIKNCKYMTNPDKSSCGKHMYENNVDPVVFRQHASEHL